MPKGNSQDLATGILFILCSIVGLVASFRYDIGTATEMGPGYFPILVFGALFIVGIATSAQAIRVDGEQLQRWAWRPLLIVLLSLGLFGMAVDRLGMVVTSALAVSVSTLAGGRLKAWEVAALVLVVTAVSSLLFVAVLGLPIPLLPRTFS